MAGGEGQRVFLPHRDSWACSLWSTLWDLLTWSVSLCLSASLALWLPLPLHLIIINIRWSLESLLVIGPPHHACHVDLCDRVLLDFFKSTIPLSDPFSPLHWHNALNQHISRKPMRGASSHVLFSAIMLSIVVHFAQTLPLPVCLMLRVRGDLQAAAV